MKEMKARTRDYLSLALVGGLFVLLLCLPG